MTQKCTEVQRKAKQEDFVWGQVEERQRWCSVLMNRECCGGKTHAQMREQRRREICKESKGNNPKENKVEIIHELN